MAAVRRLLTNESSRNAPPAPTGRQIITRDTRLRGFYRVDGATCSTYYCQADCTDAIGRRRTIRRKIGDVQLIDVDDARNEARKLIAKIKAGEFTGADKPQEVTLKEAWQAFQDSRGHRLSTETLRSYQKSIETVLGELLDLPLRRLSETAAARKEMRDMHRRVTAERGPYAANRAFQALRAVYNHARKGFDGVPDIPPTALVNFNPERRYQVGDVLPEFWSALERVENPIKRAFHAVLLLSGSRPGALSRLRWSDVDLDRRTAFIANPKGGERRAFEMVLSAPMIEHMQSARYDDEFVFFGMRSQNSYREPSMPVPAGKLRNVYMAVAKKIHVDDLFLKLLVNHKVSDVTHGYAGQRSIVLETLIAEQERISGALDIRHQ